jgi:hypothetical protein
MKRAIAAWRLATAWRSESSGGSAASTGVETRLQRGTRLRIRDHVQLVPAECCHNVFGELHGVHPGGIDRAQRGQDFIVEQLPGVTESSRASECRLRNVGVDVRGAQTGCDACVAGVAREGPPGSTPPVMKATLSL